MSARPFTSNLSVSQFALTEAAGLTPLGLVQGCASSWVQALVPAQPVTPGHLRSDHPTITPVPDLDVCFDAARGEAIAEIERQALEAGAHLVVSLRALPDPLGWSGFDAAAATTAQVDAEGGGVQRLVSLPLTYQLLGTAAREPGQREPRPRLTTLSAPDAWKLRGAGWEIAGLVTATSFRAAVSGRLPWGRWTPETAWGYARRTALERLRVAAHELGADGVIAITEVRHHRRLNLLFPPHMPVTLRLSGLELMGTAVRRRPGRRRLPNPAPTVML